MKKSTFLGTAVPAALLIATCNPALADLLGDDFFVGTSGDGLIFSDPAEGVAAPGIKAVTFTRTRISDGSGGWIYVDPFMDLR